MKNNRNADNIHNPNFKNKVPSKIRGVGSPKNEADLPKSPTANMNKLTHWKSEKGLKISESEIPTQDQLTKSALSSTEVGTVNSPEA